MGTLDGAPPPTSSTPSFRLSRTSTTHRLRIVLSLPPKWLSMYSDFIIKNASAVSQIESALSSLTYIIPGRFRESELASESLHTLIQLLRLYHDGLLSRAVQFLPANQRPVATPHNRYTKFWTKKSPSYQRVAMTLQVIQYTELLVEMAAKKRGERTRWRAVVGLESIKAVCRLLLLRLTRSRPLVTPALPEREIDPSKLEDNANNNGVDGLAYAEEQLSDFSPSEKAKAVSDDDRWTMPRTGLSMPSLPHSGDISSYLHSRVLTADDIKPPKTLLHRVRGYGELAEIMFILRPVIYAMILAHFAQQKGRDGRKNWTPWLIGVAMEYGARQLAKRDMQDRIAGGWRGLSKLEREELRKRAWAMGWWIMRGAFYENVTKTWIHSFTNRLKDIPLLNIAGGVVEDYQFLWDQYYFPTATM